MSSPIRKERLNSSVAVEQVRRGFRPDIQGLRAVAVGLVVLNHAGIPGISGGYVGVDVFFVISGYLITSHLMSTLDREGRIDFADFYARRARRILPASFAVLILTVLASLIWLPPLELDRVFKGAIATALYVPNMLFAVTGTDYLAGGDPSVFQHYWSLGVEEQFYVVWPALLLLGFLIAKKKRTGVVVAVLTVVGVSLLFCIFLTYRSQPWAFFSLPTRAWELAVGGLVALASMTPKIKVSPVHASVGGWFGLLLLASVSFTFDETLQYPGGAAILPVLAAALVIFYGNHTQSAFAPAGLLGLRGMQWIGLLSYSIYLVHWPLILIPQLASGTSEPLPVPLTLALALLSLPLAWVLYRCVENPMRSPYFLLSRRPLVTLWGAATLSAIVSLGSLGAIGLASTTALDSGKSVQASTLSVSPSFTSFVPDNLQPSLRMATSDNPSIYANGCHADESATAPKVCTSGSSDAPRSVALFGDSHAAQWYPALDKLADSGQVQLQSYTKSACPSVEIHKLHNGNPYEACDDWRQAVLNRLLSNPPDIIVIANYAQGQLTDASLDFHAEWRSGLESTLAKLPPSSQVLLLADTPSFEANPAVCLSAHLESTLDCSRERSAAVDAASLQIESDVASETGTSFLSLNDYVCSAETCSSLIGNFLAYRDTHHLTATFSRALSADLQKALERLTPPR